MFLLLRYFLWIAPNALLVVVLAKFLYLRLHRRFPLFCAYLVYQLVHFVVMLTINFVPSFTVVQYQWAAVYGQGISSLLKFAIIYEVADDLLVSRSALTPILSLSLRWITASLLLVAAIASGFLFRAGLERVTNVFAILAVSSNMILVGLLLLLFVFKRAFHVAWQNYTTGIMLGFGIFACIELASSAFRVEYGTKGNIIVDLIGMAGYLICVLTWFLYLFLPESAPQLPRATLRMSELEAWDQELQRMARR
jgi:hypothetical protein